MERGLNPSTLRHWAWRFAKEERSEGDIPQRMRFASVRRVTSPATGSPTPSAASPTFTVAVGPVRIEVGHGFDEGTLRRLLDVVTAREGER